MTALLGTAESHPAASASTRGRARAIRNSTRQVIRLTSALKTPYASSETPVTSEPPSRITLTASRMAYASAPTRMIACPITTSGASAFRPNGNIVDGPLATMRDTISEPTVMSM